MPPSNHGAFKLGKTLRRPIVTTMISLEATLNVTTELMRSTVSKGGRALPNAAHTATLPPQSRVPSADKTWHPKQGIVFGPDRGTHRSMSTSAATETKSGFPAHLASEDSHLVASAVPGDVAPKAAVNKLRQIKYPDLSKSDEPAARPENPQTAPPKKATKTKEEIALREQSAEEFRRKQLEDILADPKQSELPETATSFKMTEKLFRAAKHAKPLTPESFWTHNLYRGPDVDGNPSKPIVHYCRSLVTAERVLQAHFKEQKVIGFDIEWKPDAHRFSKAKQNVSLVQLASEGRIGLFHLALFSQTEAENLVPPTLKTIMEDPEITKVGVAIKGDCTRMKKHLNIDSRGIFELSHLHKLVKCSENKTFSDINRRLVSLAVQVQEHLHLPLHKGEVRGSDWSQKLDLQQIIYAASDSYAGLQLFETLELRRMALDPTPPRPCHAELNLPIRIAEGIEIPSDVEAEEAEEPEAKTEIKEPESARTKRRYTKRIASPEVGDEDQDPDAAFESSQGIASPGPIRPTHSTRSTVNISEPQADDSSHFKDPLVYEAESLSFLHTSGQIAQDQRPSYTPTHSPQYDLRGPLVRNHRHRNLQTYFLWYKNPSLSIPEIGSLLRSPPLSNRSIAIMILEAVRVENLPYEKERLKEVLSAWRSWGARFVVSLRYVELEKECGYDSNEN